MNLKYLDSLVQKLKDLKALRALSGYKDHAGAEKASEIAIRSSDPKWTNRVQKFLGSQIRVPLDQIHALMPGPSSEELPQHGLEIGSLPEYPGSQVRLPKEYMDQGIFIGARTGAGKTFLNADICSQLLNDPDSEIRVSIFDRKGRGEYHNLLAPHIRAKKLVVLGYKQYRRNLLEVMPGEEPLEAINRFTDLLWSTSVFLRHGTTNLIASLIKDLYTELGVFDGSKDYPSLVDLSERVSRLRFRATSRYAGYQESATSRIDNFLNQMAETFSCKQGHSIQQLLNTNILWRVGGLNDRLYKLLVEDLLRCVLTIRANFPVEGMRNLFIIDEAHLLLSGSTGTQDQGEDFLTRFARLCRSSGCGLLISDQTPSLLRSAVLANMSTRIVMQIVNGPCVRRMAESMSLTHEQADMLPRLKPRQAVMHFIGYPDSAFLIQIPELDFTERISEEEITQIMGPVLGELEWTPCSQRSTGKPDQKPNTSREQVTKEEQDYLIAIAQNPFIALTELDKTLNISLWKGHSLRKKLGSKGMTTIHRMKTGKRGNPISVVEILEPGWQYLETIEAKVERPKGVGGLLHRYYQYQIKKWYEGKYNECIAMIEDTTFGKAVDIGIHFSNTKTAVEVLIHGEEKEISNITKDLEHYDVVICCAEDREALDSLKEIVEVGLDSEKRERVCFKLLSEFLN